MWKDSTNLPVPGWGKQLPNSPSFLICDLFFFFLSAAELKRGLPPLAMLLGCQANYACFVVCFSAPLKSPSLADFNLSQKQKGRDLWRSLKTENFY